MTFLPAASAPTRSPRTGLRQIYAVWRQRQVLKTLDDRALEDIGVSYRDASAEARRPLWDAPSTWTF